MAAACSRQRTYIEDRETIVSDANWKKLLQSVTEHVKKRIQRAANLPSDPLYGVPAITSAQAEILARDALRGVFPGGGELYRRIKGEHRDELVPINFEE